MTAQSTPHTEPEQRFTSDELFRAIERNRGRLQAVEFACFGLAQSTGKNAACLVWILDDVLADLDRVAATLDTHIDSSS